MPGLRRWRCRPSQAKWQRRTDLQACRDRGRRSPARSRDRCCSVAVSQGGTDGPESHPVPRAPRLGSALSIPPCNGATVQHLELAAPGPTMLACVQDPLPLCVAPVGAAGVRCPAALRRIPEGGSGVVHETRPWAIRAPALSRAMAAWDSCPQPVPPRTALRGGRERRWRISWPRSPYRPTRLAAMNLDS